jgi:uncharacterized protein YlzI (FlbEa/FlbD family)
MKNRKNSYVTSLIEALPNRVWIFNTDEFDGCVQVSEFAHFLKQLDRRVTIIDASKSSLTYSKALLRFLYFVSVGNIPAKVFRVLKKRNIEVKKLKLWLTVALLTFRFKERVIDFDDYEISCLRTAFCNKDPISFLKFKQKSFQIKRKDYWFFNAVFKLLEKGKPECVVLRNGRFSNETIIYLACRRLGIKVSMLEGGGRPDTIELFQSSPHKASDYRNRVEAWDKCFIDDRKASLYDVKLNANWLSEASNDAILASFTKRQSDSGLEMFDKHELENSVIYYTSSLWEVPSIPEFGDIDPRITWESNVKKLYDCCKELGLNLVIKVHPNPDHEDYEIIEDSYWSRVCRSLNVKIIPASSAIVTADLIVKCWTNVVEASSVSLECVAFGAPIITLAETPWFQPSQVPVPIKIGELKTLIGSRQTYTGDLVLPYLNYRNRGGFPYAIFKVDDVKIELISGDLIASKESFHKIIRSVKRCKMSVLSIIHDKSRPHS